VGLIMGLVALTLASPGVTYALVLEGALAPTDAPLGCVHDSGSSVPGSERCGQAVAGLSRPGGLAVSPDGRHLYVVGQDSDSVVALARSPHGSLRSPGRPSSQGCVQGEGPRVCSTVDRGLGGVDALAVSPDGRYVYVGSLDRASVTALARHRNGRLTGLRGAGRCLQGNPGLGEPRHACPRHLSALTGVVAVAVSPDGRNVYALSSDPQTARSAVVGLRRSRRNGGLGALAGRGGCVGSARAGACSVSAPGLRGAAALTISPDGRFVYVASALSSAVTVLVRHPGSGRLRPLPGAGGCLIEAGIPPSPSDRGCQWTAGGLGGARALALSANGRQLYVGAFDPGSVAVLTRNRLTGRLASSAAPGTCLAAAAEAGCSAVPELRGTVDLDARPDGRAVYVSAQGANALISLGRDPASGTLATDSSGPRSLAAFNAPGRMVIGPGGRQLYLGSPVDDAVVALSLPPGRP
jgi:DNA-binding beta-propeller fold protein YncE